MGCRNMEKCEEAAREIRGSTLNPHVYARHVDLASIKSIRSFAENINKGRTCAHTHTPYITIILTVNTMNTGWFSEPINYCVIYYDVYGDCIILCVCVCSEEEKVDILINNAAVMRCPAGKTEDGFDMQLGVNFLGENAAFKGEKTVPGLRFGALTEHCLYFCVARLQCKCVGFLKINIIIIIKDC